MFRLGSLVAQRLVIVLVLFGIGTALMAAPAVSAQEEAPIKLSITPVDIEGNYFDLTLEPGEARELSVRLANNGPDEIAIRTYPADTYTIVNGGFGARNTDEPTTGTTRWIDYKSEMLDLKPDETIVRSFMLKVPVGVNPGQYLTSLVIENAEPVGNNTDGGIGFNQIIRQAIAVAIRVPGPDAPSLAFGEASHSMTAGKSTIHVQLMNTGNVHLVPYGELALTDTEGTEVARVPLKMAVVYAGTDTLIDTGLPMLLEAGDYTATLMLQEDKYGTRVESGPLSISIPVLVAPEPVVVADPGAEPVIETQVVGIPTWALLIVIPVAIVAGVVLAFAMMKRRMQPVPVPASAQPRMVVRENPPAVINKRVPVRQIVPPGHRGENA